jgi:pre-mRNA-processing factor 40
MVTDRRTADIDRDALRLIFDRLYEKVLKRNEEEKHAADRHQRRAIDGLRSRIKHLDPPVRSSDSWEVVRPRVEKTEEYRALESDEVRKVAFDKVIKRLKEKDEDVDRDRDRRRSRREDDRDPRNGHSSRLEGRRGRLSRTPEADAYEADRRKAIADREKSYRKSNALGLSPPPSLSSRDRDRDRDRRDRDRDRDDRHGRLERSPPPRHLSHYDRERRDREEERERLYRTRGDPRGSRDELNYGEESRSVTGSERRRRRGGESDGDSDGSGRRTNKRHRRDRRDSRDNSHLNHQKSKTPDPRKEPPPEPTGVHSGSEEGEIEED